MNIKIESLGYNKKLILLDQVTILGYTIPEGFTWDGASVPKVLWSLFPPYRGTLAASLLHDYLCSRAIDAKERKAADGAFKRALVEICNMSTFKANLAYLGVRAGAHLGVGVRYKHWTDNLRR